MYRLVVLFAATLVVATGCDTRHYVQSYDRAPSLTLRVQDETYLAGGSAAVSFTATEDADSVTVQVRAEDASALKACYFDLAYDAAQLSPVAATSGDALGSCGEVLQLAHTADTGVVRFGAVLAHYDQQPGFNGDGVLATVHFGRTAFVPQPARAASLDLLGDYMNLRSPLTFDDADGRIHWRYAQPGDYDQNGEVGLSDLTRLALYIGQKIEYSGGNAYSAAASVADGDVNGEVNISDISVIGANFGAVVTGVDIYAVAEDGLYPAYPAFPSRESAAAAKVGSVAFSTATGDPISERLEFSFTVGTPHKWMWAQPVVTKGRAVPTRFGWAAPGVAGLDLYDPEGYQFRYDSDNNSLTWFYNLWGDWDRDDPPAGECSIADLSAVGARLGIAASDPSQLDWAIDRYRNGVVGVDDVMVLAALLESSVEGYYVYGTTSAAEVPADPYAPETLTPLMQIPYLDPQGFNIQRFAYSFTPSASSGWYFWVRPYSGTEVGTRSGVVQVP